MAERASFSGLLAARSEAARATVASMLLTYALRPFAHVADLLILHRRRIILIHQPHVFQQRNHERVTHDARSSPRDTIRRGRKLSDNALTRATLPQPLPTPPFPYHRSLLLPNHHRPILPTPPKHETRPELLLLRAHNLQRMQMPDLDTVHKPQHIARRADPRSKRAGLEHAVGEVFFA